MYQQFNLDEALELVKQGARIDGKDEVLAPLIKQLLKLKLNLIYLFRSVIVETVELSRQ